jgi:hypothetical protein
VASAPQAKIASWLPFFPRLFAKRWATALNVRQNNEYTMSIEDNKAVIRRLFDAFNKGDLNALDGVLAASAVDHMPIEGQSPGVSRLE